MNAKRSAANENARRIKAAPLLAAHGLIPMVTPEEREAEVRATIRAQDEKIVAGEARAEAAAARYKREVADQVSIVVFRGWEERLRALPDNPAYRADFWHTRKRELGLCAPVPPTFICSCFKEGEP